MKKIDDVFLRYLHWHFIPWEGIEQHHMEDDDDDEQEMNVLEDNLNYEQETSQSFTRYIEKMTCLFRIFTCV